MTTTEDYAALPDGFADLAPLARIWARPSENERNAVRYAATPSEFAAFNAALLPRLADLLAYLQECPVRPTDPIQRNALMLACAYAEAAPHHELYSGSNEVPFSFDARRFVADHGNAVL